MKEAFKLCDSCNLQHSCETGVALELFKCGREIEIRTCKAYELYKRDAFTIITEQSITAEEEKNDK